MFLLFVCEVGELEVCVHMDNEIQLFINLMLECSYYILHGCKNLHLSPSTIQVLGMATYLHSI